MAWNDVSESAVVKCFTKAGMLDAEGNANAVKCSNSEVDPFAELQDKFAAVESLVKETREVSAISRKETVDGSFDPPVCFKLPDNWEDTFFWEVAHEQGEETNDAGERGVSEDESPAILSKLSRRLSREDRSIILFMDNAPCQPVFVQDWSCLAY